MSNVADTQCVRIPAGADSKEPVRITWALSKQQPRTRLEVTVGKSGKSIIVEELRTEPTPTSHPPHVSPLDCTRSAPEESGNTLNHFVEVVLEDGAQLEFISVNRASGDATIAIEQRSQLGASATIAWRNITLGGSKVEHDLQSRLTGADATSEIDWMFYAKDQEKYSLTARNVFNAPRGGGEITMKGVAEEHGHVRCNGMIDIGKGGRQTDTYLTQDVLMLDATAKVDATPALKIKTNDVKASHSASISRISDEDIFYLASRGVAQKDAKRMLVEGFLGDMLKKMTAQDIQEQIIRLIEAKYIQGTK